MEISVNDVLERMNESNHLNRNDFDLRLIYCLTMIFECHKYEIVLIFVALFFYLFNSKNFFFHKVK